MQNKKPTVLVILDGWGEAPKNRAMLFLWPKHPS